MLRLNEPIKYVPNLDGDDLDASTLSYEQAKKINSFHNYDNLPLLLEIIMRGLKSSCEVFPRCNLLKKSQISADVSTFVF